MSRQTQNSKMAAEGGFGSLPDPRRQTKRRGDKQEASSKVKAVPPTQEAVDAAAEEKYGPEVAAFQDELQQKFQEKIDKIQAKSDEKVAKAERQMEEMRAAFHSQQDVHAAAQEKYGPEVARLEKEFNEKIAKIQADCKDKIAAAEVKMNLRRGIAEGETWVNDNRSAATGLDSVATSGGRGRKKYKDSATRKMVPELTLPEALGEDKMLITWYTGTTACFDDADVEFPAEDGKIKIVTMPLLIRRAPDTESGSFLCYDVEGNRVHCKHAGPYRKPDAVTLESIHKIPAFKKALNPLQEVDDLFKGLKVRMAEGRRSDGASSASMDTDGR